MPWKITRLALLCFSLGSVESVQGQPLRQVELVVRSSADPAADILIDPAFSFLGRVSSVVMNGQATAEQFWFVKVDSGRITRAVIAHFERWNDGVEGAFNYPALRMQRLGDHDYLHQSFPMEQHCQVASHEVRELMRRAGLTMAAECVGTRFVRAASTDKRKEVILFYIEPVDALPSTEGLGPGGLPVGYDRPTLPPSPWATTDRRLTEEALRTIRVRDRH